MRITRDDDELEWTLQDHLAGELDGQLGRAQRAFHEHLAAAQIATVEPMSAPRRRSWLVRGLFTAAAASLAALWAVPILWPAGKTHVVNNTVPVVDGKLTPPAQVVGADSRDGWQQVDQVISSRTVDNGLYLIDGKVPARSVLQLSMERTEWVDEHRGRRIEKIVPRQEIMFLELDTY